MRNSAAKVLDHGLTQAHRVFADYISPDRKVTAEKAMNQLLGILDDQKFIQAWVELQEDAYRPGTELPVTLLPHPPH